MSHNTMLQFHLADLSGVDWPLVLGSFSAAVLFLCSVALVVMVARRKGISQVYHESLLSHRYLYAFMIAFLCENLYFLSTASLFTSL